MALNNFVSVGPMLTLLIIVGKHLINVVTISFGTFLILTFRFSNPFEGLVLLHLEILPHIP